MTKQLAFVTRGEIDLRAFTTFGFNAKPNTTSPIGFFGTGLKIATAVIARLGCRMTVIINGVQHEFYTKTTDFRGKTFNVIRMRKRNGIFARWQYQEMPYTTELGKNWEPWQVFRELESNTRDEGGTTFLIDDEESSGMSFLNEDHAGQTVILVDEPSVIKAWEERDTIFLPSGLDIRSETNRCQAFNVGSKYLFYRGMRVVELDKPSAFTYNILAEQRLTEDRTLYSWNAQWEVRKLIMESSDAEFIEQIIKLEEDKFWESRIEFDDVYAVSGETFREVVGKRRGIGAYLLPRISTFWERYHVTEPDDPEVTVTLLRSEWTKIAQVLEAVDLYEVRPTGWEEEDEKFDPFIKLRSILEEKAPVPFQAMTETELVEAIDALVPTAPTQEDEDEIPF